MEKCTSLSRAQLKQALIDCMYFHLTDVERDVLEVIATFDSLMISTDTYVSNDGAMQKLVCIKGTIPVDYKGIYFNIPLCIWLSKSHPTLPPLVYIRPTRTMELVAGPYVDQAGLVTHPYLDKWDKDQSDLSGLVQILCAVFAENTPVFTKKQEISQTESSVDKRTRAGRERLGSDKEQVQLSEKGIRTVSSALGTGGVWLGTNRARFRTDGALTTTGGEQARADGVWTKAGGTFSRGKGAAVPHTANSSVSSARQYMEEKSTCTPKDSSRCEQLRQKKESLLHTIDDVITKAKVLQCEAQTIATILETSKSNLMKESFSLEGLNAVKNNERTPRWQKGLGFTLEDVGNMAERVISDIEDYELLKRQEEPRALTAKKSYMDWNTDELCLWFASIGFSECIPLVQEHRLKGAHLPDLSKDDMIELGIKKLGDRITVDNEINKLCGEASNLFS